MGVKIKGGDGGAWGMRSRIGKGEKKNCNGKTNTREEAQGYYCTGMGCYSKRTRKMQWEGKKGTPSLHKLTDGTCTAGFPADEGDHGGLEWVNGWWGRF